MNSIMQILEFDKWRKEQPNYTLCDDFGHPVYVFGDEEIICPRCGEKVVSQEKLLHPEAVSVEEFFKGREMIKKSCQFID